MTNLRHHSTLYSFIKRVKSEQTRNYITDRILPWIDYSSMASLHNKRKFYRYTMISIILSAAIPIITTLADDRLWQGQSLTFIKLTIILLGAFVTIINSYLALNNYKDLWLLQHEIRENLLRTLYFYFNSVEDFEQGTQKEKDALLIRLCEKEIAKENENWQTLMKKIDTNTRQN